MVHRCMCCPQSQGGIQFKDMSELLHLIYERAIAITGYSRLTNCSITFCQLPGDRVDVRYKFLFATLFLLPEVAFLEIAALFHFISL